MQIGANRDFGQLLYTLMRQRMVEADYEMPLVVIGSLSSTLDLTVREIHSLTHALDPKHHEGSLAVEQILRLNLEFHPHVQILIETLMAMVWLSRLEPGDTPLAVQVLIRVVGFFDKYNCRAIDNDEMVALHERIIALFALRQGPDTLGAIGETAYDMATQPLSTLGVRRNTPDARRRRTYLRKVRALCLELEGARVLADQKAVNARIGEVLLAELRASKAPRTDRTMGRFWDKAGLLLGRKN